MNMRRRPGQGGGGLCRESESGVFLTMGRIAAAPAWRDRSKSHDREPARIHVCIPVAAASGGLSDLRWCCRSGCCRQPVGHHLSCSFTSLSPEPTSATSDLVTVWALSEKTENRRT